MLQLRLAVDTEEIAKSALTILKGWRWGYIDPDGLRISQSIELQHALNRLAFCGCDDPAKAILALLCDGRLTAFGDYQWLYFRNHTRFAFSGSMEELDRTKWQKLEGYLREIKWGGEEEDWAQKTVNLTELEVQNEPTAEWKPEYNRCSYAA